MIQFLTSNTGHTVFRHGRYVLGPFYEENGLRAQLQALWPKKARMLIVTSEPDDVEFSESLVESTRGALQTSGLPARLKLLDRRTQDRAEELVAGSDVIQLCGGHVPTMIAFLREMNMADLLRRWDGILIGISAGSMNCGSLVYASPEREGEALDPDYERWIEGMNLCDLTFLPHFNQLTDMEVDGLRVVEDIMLPDSYEVPFFTIPDGSYFRVDDDGTLSLHGEGYWVENGQIEQICALNEEIFL